LGKDEKVANITPSVEPTALASPGQERLATAPTTEWSGMVHQVVGLGIESLHALLIELGSLETQVVWTIQGNGEICHVPAEDAAQNQFPGMITILSRIASAPKDDLLAQCRSPRHWVFGWRVDEKQIIVMEVNFRRQRSDISESDLATLRLLGDTSLRENRKAPLPPTAVEENPQLDGDIESFSTVSVATDPAQAFSEPSAPILTETPIVAPLPSPAEVPPAPPIDLPFQAPTPAKTVDSFVPPPPERRPTGFGRSTRKTIAIPVGYHPEPEEERFASRSEQPLSEADTLIGIADSTQPEPEQNNETLANDSHLLGHDTSRTDASPSFTPDRDNEFPQAYSETVAWPPLTPPETRRRSPLVSALGLALAILCTLLSLWVAAMAVPETVASYQADAQRRRTMSDQTMIRDLSLAMASGDYGDVQTVLSSFASMGYFESALVSNSRNRVVAQAGSDTGIRIGDETPPDVKKFARIIDLSLANEPQGKLMLLHEENIEDQQQYGLWTLQIGAVVVGLVSFIVTLLIALRLYRAPLARFLLRNR